jgi:hypothetical protein
VPTEYADTLDPPLLGTKAQFPSDVIPPASGLAPVDAVAGDSAVNAPVAELYLYSEIWKDPPSTAYTKSRAGLIMNEAGRVPAPTVEPIWVNVPFALAQVAVACIQA